MWNEFSAIVADYGSLCRLSVADVAIYRFASGTTAMRALVRRLCEASTS
jgi:hypothetical protein